MADILEAVSWFLFWPRACYSAVLRRWIVTLTGAFLGLSCAGGPWRPTAPTAIYCQCFSFGYFTAHSSETSWANTNTPCAFEHCHAVIEAGRAATGAGFFQVLWQSSLQVFLQDVSIWVSGWHQLIEWFYLLANKIWIVEHSIAPQLHDVWSWQLFCS